MISPDDVARAVLVAKADKWFWGLIGFTLILLVGAIMEELHPLNRLHTHSVNTRTRTRTPRIWVIRSQKAYEIAAVVLVIGGIAGEGFCEFFGAKAEDAVRNFDNEIAIKAGVAAKDALGDATDAQDAASDAQDSSDKADKHAGEAAKKAALAGKEADKLGNEISMVQYFSTSRAVHDQKSLKAQLEPFSGKPAIFRSYKNDGDGYITCGELVFVAQSAGMVTTNQCGEWPFPDGTTLADGTVWPTTGLFVSGPSDDSMLALEQVLSRVSPGFGAGAGPFGKNAQRPPMFVVFVGKKSDVFVGDTAQTRDAERRAMKKKKTTPQPKP